MSIISMNYEHIQQLYSIQILHFQKTREQEEYKQLDHRSYFVKVLSLTFSACKNIVVWFSETLGAWIMLHSKGSSELWCLVKNEKKPINNYTFEGYPSNGKQQ